VTSFWFRLRSLLTLVEHCVNLVRTAPAGFVAAELIAGVTDYVGVDIRTDVTWACTIIVVILIFGENEKRRGCQVTGVAFDCRVAQTGVIHSRPATDICRVVRTDIHAGAFSCLSGQNMV